MDDETRVDDAPRAGRVWLRRTGWALLALLLLGLSGLQVQAARVRGEVTRAEAAQTEAELDQEAAQIRLDSVGARVEVAREEEADAQGVLDGSREAMAAAGLEEAALDDVRRRDARHVKDLRRQNATVDKAIAEQNRLQPAAAACLFDLLRALGRVDGGTSGGSHSEACTTVSGHAPANG